MLGRKDNIVSRNTTCIEVLKQMDASRSKVLLVMDENKFEGLITIGDIQRAIIKNIDIKTPIFEIIDKNKTYASTSDSQERVKQLMISMRAELMPVLNENKELVKIYYWEDLFSDAGRINSNTEINLPVVIMAGGKGTRLSPLTNIYPKPLIPVGEKTIIETIMDRFLLYSCNRFFISVNYRAEMIENYFNFVNNRNYHIQYFREDKPLGTAGSLRLLKNKIDTTFFVSNCDILIDEDYSQILEYHRKNKNELTVVAAMVTYSIPYGTICTGRDGLLETIEEKPSLSFKINTGLYIVEPSVINEIPDDFFHITHLMEKLHKQGRRVGVYPISQNDWKDMGDWKEYLKFINVR